MESILIKVAQLFLSLTILVIIHELGHYIAARIFKVRVDKFYVFFNPWFSLFKWKPKNSDTEFGVGWLPLGGYCKIAGMIDESMDLDQMKKPPKPDEFRSKPAWQRLVIMIAGVFMNLILAFFIYSMILFYWGEQRLPMEDITMGMVFSDAAKEVGFKDGDVICTADGEKVLDFNEFWLRKILNARHVEVLRDGVRQTVDIPDDMLQRVIAGGKGFMGLRIPMVVDSIIPESPALQAGLQKEDRILKVGDQETPTIDAVRSELDLYKGAEVFITVLRSGSEVVLPIHINEEGNMGIYMKSLGRFYQMKKYDYSFFESFSAGVDKAMKTLHGYTQDMKFAFTTKEGAQSIGGFATIGSIFPSQWNWSIFWERTAFLSIILAVMNILPIPALDGGHVLFLLYEVVTRRKPGDKFLEYAQVAGLFFLLALMLYANGNDILRYFFR